MNEILGLVLAGGLGSRLWPLTSVVSKQLLPIYDKPMIFYPLSTLMLAGIRNFVIIVNPQDKNLYQDLFDGYENLGIQIEIRTQERPRGIAESFLIAQDKIEASSEVALILGDNLFHGSNLGRDLSRIRKIEGGHIFAYEVSDPENYGVVEFDSEMLPVSIVEKPKVPKSNFVVPGLYFYNKDVLEIARNLQPSSRGELEISSVNEAYLKRGKLVVQILSRGTAWLDTGTIDSLHDAASYVKSLQLRQGNKIACLEEISLLNGWINQKQLDARILRYGNSNYANYLKKLGEIFL